MIAWGFRGSGGCVIIYFGPWGLLQLLEPDGWEGGCVWK